MDGRTGRGMRAASIFLGVLLSLATLSEAPAKEGTIALKLVGQYCNFYLDDVKKALMKVPGVSKVSFDKSGGTAIVTADPGKVTAGILIRTIRGVHGDSWSCDAEKAK